LGALPLSTLSMESRGIEIGHRFGIFVLFFVFPLLHCAATSDNCTNESYTQFALTIYNVNDWRWICNNAQEKFEDTKWVIRSHMSKKNKQYNSQKKKNKQYNSQKQRQKDNDLQNNMQKTKDCSTWTQGEVRCSRRVGSPCSTNGAHRVTLVTTLF